MSAIVEASEGGDLQLVQSLVTQVRPEVVQSAFGSAFMFGHASIVSPLLEHGAKLRPITSIMALDSGSIAVFRTLKDLGWDVNSPITIGGPILRFGHSPLSFFC
jgi:hypothetical protein